MDAVIVGAGPVGLMLAAELRLGGARVVVLERRAGPDDRPRANGLVGRIVEQLDHRGLLERFRAEAGFAGAFPGFPFGGVPLRFAGLERPIQALMLQQPRMEALLAERAAELDVELRRGHELTALTQDEDGVDVEVRGPDGEYLLRAGYVVGCDGAHSRVRELAGIGFPGTTDGELLRMGHFVGDLKLFDRPAGGWSRTPRGRVLVTSLKPGVTIVGVREISDAPSRGPLELPEFTDSLRRVLGTELQLGEPIWLSRTVSEARLADQYRRGRVFLAGDAAHLFPAGGSALNVGLLDAVNLGWKLTSDDPAWLDTYEEERRPVAARTLVQTRVQALLDRLPGDDGDALRSVFGELAAFPESTRHLAELLRDADELEYVPDWPLVVDGRKTRVAEVMRSARPVLFDFADRADIRKVATVDVVTAKCPDAPADAVLVRPDGVIAAKGNDPRHIREGIKPPGR